MLTYKPLINLPEYIQKNWQAELNHAEPTEHGIFQLVDIRTTAPKSFQEQRIIVMVVDENGFPLPNVPVAFSYSSAPRYTVNDDFLWSPPNPRAADVVSTQGGGQIEEILGAEGVVKKGQSGGMTVYILEPNYSSDYVSGLGILADHTGLHLTFQLRRTGVEPVLEGLEARLQNLEMRLAALEERAS